MEASLIHFPQILVLAWEWEVHCIEVFHNKIRLLTRWTNTTFVVSEPHFITFSVAWGGHGVNVNVKSNAQGQVAQVFRQYFAALVPLQHSLMHWKC